ncbi:MAG: hypothetical protein JXB50_12815 [Spirochaetes bacterium]|nr:hypothetical protein [Spirochaetota bacterium]
MVEIKGTVLSDSIEAVKKRTGYDSYKKILALLSYDARKLFGISEIVYSDLYPLDLFIEFLSADIKITTEGDEKVLITRSEEMFEKQLRGIYKIFIKIGSPEFVIKKITSTHKYYFRGVTIETLLFEKNKARIKYSGFEMHHHLIEYAIIGFYKKALELSGAKKINCKCLTKIIEGKGFSEIELIWSNR